MGLQLIDNPAMSLPKEIEARREMVDVSQLTSVLPNENDDDSDDDLTCDPTPNKRSSSCSDPLEFGEGELTSTPSAPKKQRAVTKVVASRRSDISTTESVQFDTSSGSVVSNKGMPSCEEHFIESQSQISVLLAMCIGLEGAKNPTFAVVNEDVNYKFRENRSKFKPSKITLMEEVKRRHKIFQGADKDKKCASFTIPQLHGYLLSHPITNEEDVRFLKEEELKFREGLDAAAKERSDLAELHTKEDAWIGDAPWLRLYHVMICSRVKLAFSKAYDWQEREGTDARNSDVQPKSFYEVAAELYNSSDFKIQSYTYGELHENFSKRIDLSLGPKIPTVTPDKIQKKLGEARAKLMSMIADWEKSGNGSGQRSEGTGFGHIIPGQRWVNVNPGDDADDSSEFADGDNRRSFLVTRRPHILYMWQLFDKYDILDMTLNKLSDTCSATGEATPSASAPKKKTEDKKSALAKREEEVFQVQQRTANAMKMIADSQTKSHLVAMENTLMHLQDRLMSETVQNNIKFKKDFEEQVRRMKEQINSLYVKITQE